jgi:predicted DNA-binding transcriptional regulator YafY
MAEHKDQEVHSKILSFFKIKSTKGWITLSVPEIMKGLEVDRRSVERALAVMSSLENPNAKLIEIEKSRGKYYVLKEVFDFCQKWAGAKNG